MLGFFLNNKYIFPYLCSQMAPWLFEGMENLLSIYYYKGLRHKIFVHVWFIEGTLDRCNTVTVNPSTGGNSATPW